MAAKDTSATTSLPDEPMRAILTQPVTGPVAWTGAEMSGTSAWLYRFPERALDELDAALAQVQAGNLALDQVTAENFPLPGLAADLAEIAHELEHGRGFVQMKGLPLQRYDERQAALLFWGLGSHLGGAISQNAQGDLLGDVRDEGLDIGNGNVRAYQTRVGQSFHTDIGADVVGLMCLQPAQRGGKSRVASSMAIYNELLKRYPWYVGLLYNNFNVDWRGEEPAGAPPVYREPIYAFYDARLSCRFAPRLIRSAQSKTGVDLSNAELEAIALVEQLAEELCFEIDFEPGDIQLINNYVTLHGRTGYEDYPEPERRRHLLRLWLTVPGARSLPPEFAHGRARAGVPSRSPS